ncbi:ARM repeat-containing protein [Annulohypoxylon maeteangense]|uniref:ARM repeat-containing protein n=1 Tax=Annulohypoxylon maeteangense TaxID=1927788 RepID=UPI0020086CE1|nr:ARM repeat-containing protein [Annulohypoxylon maeteangense]KAI0884789.1 ARM repeat-containing protein [Annulohypoxylon maeteangense]
MSTPVPSTGSPTPRRPMATKAVSKEENVKVGTESSSTAIVSDILERILPQPQKKAASALSTSSLVNQSYPKKIKLSHEPSGHPDSSPMDNLLEHLNHHTNVLNQQGEAFKASEDGNSAPPTLQHASSSSSVPITPATETFGSTAPTTRPASATLKKDGEVNKDEVLRLKLELAQAQNKISRLDHELTQTRQIQPGLEYGIGGSPVDNEFSPEFRPDSDPSRVLGPLAPNAVGHQAMGREGQYWSSFDDSRSDTSDALSATGFNRSRRLWGPKNNQGPFQGGGFPGPDTPHNQWNGRSAQQQGFMDQNMAYEPSVSGNYRGDRLTPDYDLTIRPSSSRRNARFDTRLGTPAFGANPGLSGGYNYGGSNYGADNGTQGPPQAPSNSGMYSNYQPTPVGTPLSPFATEFTSATGVVPWKPEPASSEGQTYLPTTEPLNYRRLLDRNVNCNWKYIVDKIICNNDQQASIFLQQKLKVGTPDQKYEIVEAIVGSAYALMVNRFGNFLVQRCFEHGTPEQVIKIAQAIRGSTLSLSMDPFGCHVVQKAFDAVPEDYKAIMVHELLRRIPETVIHRYACHVWQKLFELRWTESPPQIMKYVNDALRGMWHEVALGETGSLVVQNIFENCLEEDKRPCIEEVLANIDIVAHGQFGNWCIQHICEHGAPADRSRAIDHVIRYAAEYSMDQYASKVVEKCLKIGGPEFLARYLDRVCEGRVDRTRIPLIDISSDQYGNYLIQWIINNASPQHREIVTAHIRKHMVSLRGSKFGSRVGMLCTNPAIVTRPGPGTGTGMGRMPAGPRYNGRGYQ